MSKYLTIFFLQFLSFFMQAQGYKFGHYTTREGLCYNAVRSITKDSTGYLWIGTSQGLSRFDGFEFKNHTQKGLKSTWISSFLVDKTGKLWVSTEGGLCYYETTRDSFIYISNDNNIKILLDAPMCLGAENTLWIAADNGLKQVDILKNTIENTPINSISGVHRIWQDEAGIIWIGSNEGLLNYDPLSKKTQKYTLKIGKWTYFIHDIFPENADNLWLATDAGLLLFNKKTANFEVFTKSNPFLKNLIITHLSEFKMANNWLWCATQNNGVLLFDRVKKQFVSQEAASLQQPSSLNTNEVNYLFEDGNRLWLGTDAGLNVINLQKQQFLTTPIAEMYNNQTLDLISKIQPDNKNPRFWWIATRNDNGILMYYDSEKKYVLKTYYLNQINPAESESNNQIRDIVYDNQGMLWLATLNGLYFKDNEKFMHIPLVNNGLDAYNIELDKKGNFWISCENGLIYFDPRKRTKVIHPLSYTGLPEQENSDFRTFPIESFVISNDSIIHLNCFKYGLFSYNFKIKKLTYLPFKTKENFLNLNRANSLTSNKLGEYWVGTSGGLVHYFEQKDSFEVIEPVHPFYVYDTRFDGLGNIWLCTNQGINRYNPQTRQFNFYGKSEGLFSQFTLSRFQVIGDHFILPYKGTLTEFQPHKIITQRRNLPVFITELTSNGATIPLATEGVMHLQASQNTLQFKFSSIDFDEPDKAEFRYKLEGFNDNWQEASPQRQANYTNLDAGYYTFVVQVKNNQGSWSAAAARVQFYIVPPFYKTFWFYGLLILTIAGLAYGFYRYRIYQLLKVQAMRNRIAADLHDDVGSTLSSISIMSELAAYKKGDNKDLLLKMSENAREMIEKMDDIVWAINPDNDAFYNLETRIKAFAIPLFESKNIDFTINFDKTTETIKLNMEQRRNIYLIMKETVNNLVKYSQAKNAVIDCAIHQNQLKIIVADDGIGFDLNNKNDRNGLKNMRQRAEKIHGELIINTTQNVGTEVSFNLKI